MFNICYFIYNWLYKDKERDKDYSSFVYVWSITIISGPFLCWLVALIFSTSDVNIEYFPETFHKNNREFIRKMLKYIEEAIERLRLKIRKYLDKT